MPGGISISSMPSNVPAESFRKQEPVVFGGSPIRSVTVVEANTADKGLLRSEGVGAAKGGLARFKAFILRPVQAVMRWVNQLLHRSALTEPNKYSVGVALTLYKEALDSKGGTRLLQELEQVGSWGRTSVAMSAKRVCGSVRDWFDVSLIAEQMLANLTEDIQKNVLKGVGKSLATEFDYSIDQRVLESVAKRAVKMVVESNTKIDAKSIASNVAKSIAKSIEKSIEKAYKEAVDEGFKERVGDDLTVGEVKKLVVQDVVGRVASRVERRIEDFAKLELNGLSSNIRPVLAMVSGVIERRNVEAKSPAPMPTLDELADMKTWLGPENSQERLGRLREGLLGIESEPSTPSSTPSSTRSAAAQLLEDIRGYGMDFWIGGDQSIEAWFGFTSEDDKLEMAEKLNGWADHATELLLKSEAEKFQVKDQGQAASNRLQYV